MSVTPVGDWKKAAITAEPVELPSGNTAIIKPAGMEAFLRSGMIPNSLMAVITSALAKAQKGGDFNPEEFDMSTLVDDPEKLQDLLQLIDNVAVSSFQDPRVWPAPPFPGPDDDPTDPKFVRRDDQLYVDELSNDDKFFAFSVAVGGTKDLEKFRRELDASVGAVRGSESVADLPKSTGGPATR